MIYDEGEGYNDLRGSDWISPSDLKGLRTPKDFLAKREKPFERKNYFDVGTACHTLVLEPYKFKTEVTYFPENDFPDVKLNKDGSRALTPKNKVAMEEFRGKNENRVVLRQKDFVMIKAMANSVFDYPATKVLLDRKNAHIEKSFYARYIWNNNGEFERIEPAEKEDKRDSENIMLVRTKSDFVHKTRLYTLDFKTTVDASPGGFSREIAKFELDIQGAMVNDLVGINVGKQYEAFVLLVVEKSPPYQSAMYDVRTQDLYEAQTVYLRRLNIIRQAMNSGKWAGFEMYADNCYGLINMKLPEWYRHQKEVSPF